MVGFEAGQMNRNRNVFAETGVIFVSAASGCLRATSNKSFMLFGSSAFTIAFAWSPADASEAKAHNANKLAAKPLKVICRIMVAMLRLSGSIRQHIHCNLRG